MYKYMRFLHPIIRFFFFFSKKVIYSITNLTNNRVDNKWNTNSTLQLRGSIGNIERDPFETGIHRVERTSKFVSH